MMNTPRQTSLSELLGKINKDALPNHVAMIMDGNGRWAQQKGLPRAEGHAEGISTVHRVVEFSSNLGIKYLTLYAFSTENWNRPQTEVDTLMYLIGWAIDRELPELIKNNVRLRLIGDIDRIPEKPRAILNDSVKKTSDCTGLTLLVCLSYSGRWDITQAVRRIARQCADGNFRPELISEQTLSDYQGFHDIPDPDLLIRTGGEYRISNFMLWQLAYSELYFSPALWPEFDNLEYAKAILDYQSRERRFGKTSQQVASLHPDKK